MYNKKYIIRECIITLYITLYEREYLFCISLPTLFIRYKNFTIILFRITHRPVHEGKLMVPLFRPGDFHFSSASVRLGPSFFFNRVNHF